MMGTRFHDQSRFAILTLLAVGRDNVNSQWPDPNAFGNAKTAATGPVGAEIAELRTKLGAEVVAFGAAKLDTGIVESMFAMLAVRFGWTIPEDSAATVAATFGFVGVMVMIPPEVGATLVRSERS